VARRHATTSPARCPTSFLSLPCPQVPCTAMLDQLLSLRSLFVQDLLLAVSPSLAGGSERPVSARSDLGRPSVDVVDVTADGTEAADSEQPKACDAGVFHYLCFEHTALCAIWHHGGTMSLETMYPVSISPCPHVVVSLVHFVL
jgi:hypothetical protein